MTWEEFEKKSFPILLLIIIGLIIWATVTEKESWEIDHQRMLQYQKELK